jgi:hypothetical protein
MKIVAISCAEAVGASGIIDVPHVMIRITCPTSPAFPALQDNPKRVAVLEQKFYDLDGDALMRDWTEEEKDKYGNGCFSNSQAREIVEFVLADRTGKIVVHCDAGISRSAGVAAAVAKFLTGSDECIFGNKRYIPNRYVYRKLLNTFMEVEDGHS